MVRSLTILTLASLAVVAGCASPEADAARRLESKLADRDATRRQVTAIVQDALNALAKDEHDRSAELALRAIEIDDGFADSWLILGLVRFQQDRLQDAAVALQRAADLAPSNPIPRYNLGIVFETAGLYDRAIEAYESALRLAPDDLYTIENLARTYVRAKQSFPRALELVQQALQREYREHWREWLIIQESLLRERVAREEAP